MYEFAKACYEIQKEKRTLFAHGLRTNISQTHLPGGLGETIFVDEMTLCKLTGRMDSTSVSGFNP